MATVWVLTVDNSPDPEAFADFYIAFANYREHIEKRTPELDWDDKNFEWEDSNDNGLKRFSCYCYGEFIARLHEVKIER